MAKTWSNRKITDYVSPVQHARNRPTSASVVATVLILISIFFIGLMTLTVYLAETRPATEYSQPVNHVDPKDD